MLEDSLISIIVPLYNVEKYIDKGIESLVHQDYTNIEIILIDDGSPDRSGTIADEWALLDKRISVIHQKNQGVSVARNTGLNRASGDYVMFMDGDDWVAPNYVSYFYNLILQTATLGAFNTNLFSVTNRANFSYDSIITAESAIEGIYSNKIDVAVWNKIYSRKIIEDNTLRFLPEIWYGEGMLFNIEYLQLVDQVSIGNKPVYNQTFNSESAMRKFNLNSNLCGIKSLDIQRDKWIKKNKAIEKAWKYHKYRFNQSILNGIVRSRQEIKYADALKTSIKGLRKGIMIPLTTEHNVKSILMWICYFIAPIYMAKRSARKHMRHAS